MKQDIINKFQDLAQFYVMQRRNQINDQVYSNRTHIAEQLKDLTQEAVVIESMLKYLNEKLK